MSQETAMQTWDFQKRNRTRTGERGLLPIAAPGPRGVCKTLRRLHLPASSSPRAGPTSRSWSPGCANAGMAEDLDEEPYASPVRERLTWASSRELMGDPAAAAGGRSRTWSTSTTSSKRSSPP